MILKLFPLTTIFSVKSSIFIAGIDLESAIGADTISYGNLN